MLFHLSTLWVILALSSMLLAAMLIGMAAGHWSRNRAADLHEQFGIVQSSVFTVIPLNLAFGLSMSVERFEARQIAVIDDANSIGTAYLRAQTLQEPVRSRSLPLYVSYTDASISLSYAVPGSAKARQAIAVGSMLQRRLWKLAGEALDAEPDTNASRLYVESLNEMIDQQTTRVALLENRVPASVQYLDIVGCVLAIGLLAFFLTLRGGGVLTMVLTTVFLTMLLFVSFDLDRPSRGFIFNMTAPLDQLRASMVLPPAANPPIPR